MYITVRTSDGKRSQQVRDISKCTKVEDLREMLEKEFEVTSERQRLFFRGKEMVDGHSLFDYGVKMNDVVLLMIRPLPKVEETKKEEEKEVDKEETSDNETTSDEDNVHSTSAVASATASMTSDLSEATYRSGDIVDVRDPTMGAWFEGRIVSVRPTPREDVTIGEGKDKTGGESSESSKSQPERRLKEVSHEDGFTYEVRFEGDDEDKIDVTGRHVRPRSRRKLKLAEVNVDDQVMVNYNYDEPTDRGYWYDAVVTKVTASGRGRGSKELVCCVFCGPELIALAECKIRFLEEVMAIEVPGAQVNEEDRGSGAAACATRETKPQCDHCKDNPRRKCKECSCRVCGGKEDWGKQLLCDECDTPYHMYCLSPPMEALPAEDDDWYCPQCRNDTSQVVMAGEKLKESKKKSKMPSATNQTSRDWGRGFACSGRSRVCTLVPPNHMGPIPGVEVGQSWLFRLQASEAGVHRPPVSGIHGRDEEGAYSIVLSGGYEDDLDSGDHFLYTGSGGRDLSGNKRTAEQSCDQKLTRMNRALARNCQAPLSDKTGADAKEKWRQGKPVRVVRNYKAHKHSKFAPKEGNRYDGIYKVVKYWPEKGKSGFLVWRYELRRDDPSPAPWSKEGKARIEELGLVMEYPEGYQEKENLTKGASSAKRLAVDEDEEGEETGPSKKKARQSLYTVPEDIQALIDQDSANKALWSEATEAISQGQKAFYERVQNIFCCLCCQDLVHKPVTTPCTHNLCLDCLKRSFSAQVYACPYCRADLSALKTGTADHVNEALMKLLLRMYPGYETGR